MEEKFIYNNKDRKDFRRNLRREMTDAESKLWDRIRDRRLGEKFRRQYSVTGYILDFYCPAKRIAIEIDGSQHIENREYDDKRTEVLKMLDIKVLRFWNKDVNKNMEGVLMMIKEAVE
jgi:very-short-patch-repair endonuclease